MNNLNDEQLNRLYDRIEQLEKENEELKKNIDAEPVKHARWIDPKHGVYKCSNCRNFLDFSGVNAGRGYANFCPNCGAKMEIENHE